LLAYCPFKSSSDWLVESGIRAESLTGPSLASLDWAGLDMQHDLHQPNLCDVNAFMLS
jgi:hypothetical protein